MIPWPRDKKPSFPSSEKKTNFLTLFSPINAKKSSIPVKPSPTFSNFLLTSSSGRDSHVAFSSLTLYQMPPSWQNSNKKDENVLWRKLEATFTWNVSLLDTNKWNPIYCKQLEDIFLLQWMKNSKDTCTIL